MPDAGSAIQPLGLADLTCPRCWFSAASFQPTGALTVPVRPLRMAVHPRLPVAVGRSRVPRHHGRRDQPVPTVIAATITLNGATIAAFTINGTAAGALTAGTYLIPVGGTFSATYSVASPTWAWALPAISAGVSAGGAALTFAPTGTNVAFAQNQVLIVDPAGTSDIVTVSGTPTATSVPVNSLNSAHSSAVLVTVAALVPANSGEQAVPLTAY